MASRSLKVDKIFFVIVIALLVAGLLIFSSASLGLLTRNGASFSSVALNHILLGTLGGSLLMFFVSKIDYRIWRKFALPIFIVTLIVTALVFVPGLGFKHGGAYRWIILGPFSFQPSEILKIGYLIMTAALLAKSKDKISTFRGGLLPFMILSGIVGMVMLAQPDTDTYMVMVLAGISMFIVAGGKIRHVLLLGVAGIALLLILASFRPYVANRLKTYMNPANDPRGSGYQIQQSLIAIGSGGMTGRGFGQSIQKFNFLPEPIGDSVFAVASEEFGFIGSVILLFLFSFFATRGLKIAKRAPDAFGGLLTVGIVVLIVSQSFLNIGAMLGVLPLSGLPLIFVSHGGTAMLFALASVGIILNISKFSKKA
jgi:cell division protein FtsW